MVRDLCIILMRSIWIDPFLKMDPYRLVFVKTYLILNQAEGCVRRTVGAFRISDLGKEQRKAIVLGLVSERVRH